MQPQRSKGQGLYLNVRALAWVLGSTTRNKYDENILILRLLKFSCKGLLVNPL